MGGTREAKDGRLRVLVISKAKNDILAAYVDSCGSLAEASRRIGVSSATLGHWVNFRSHLSERSIRRFPEKFKGVVPALERETGYSVDDIFPALSSKAREFLAKPRVSRHEVSTVRIEHAINNARVAYRVDLDTIDAPELMRLAMMECLTEKERLVVSMRYGIGEPGGVSKTLDEVGAAMRLTRERIRQIEAKAIRKLQSPNATKHIVGLVDDSVPVGFHEKQRQEAAEREKCD